jgi:hypothetical protein
MQCAWFSLELYVEATVVTASMAPVRAVHLVGHNGSSAVPLPLAARFVEKRCNLLGENRS